MLNNLLFVLLLIGGLAVVIGLPIALIWWIWGSDGVAAFGLAFFVFGECYRVYLKNKEKRNG